MSVLDTEHFSRGSVAKLFLEITASGVGQTGESPTVSIQRLSDGLWLDPNTNTFVVTRQEAALVQVDATNLPGLYSFDFDHTIDTTLSQEFVARFTNTGANALTEHAKIMFGKITDTVNAETCNITGTIFTAAGARAPNTLVRATIIPVASNSLGQGFQNVEVITTYTDSLGEFDLTLARGLNAKLEIEDIGYDKKVCVPDQATVLFTDL